MVGEYVSVDIPEEFNLSDILVDRHLREGRGIMWPIIAPIQVR